MAARESNSALGGYAEVISALHVADKRNQTIRNRKAVVVGALLVVLGCLCGEGLQSYDESGSSPSYDGGQFSPNGHQSSAETSRPTTLHVACGGV